MEIKSLDKRVNEGLKLNMSKMIKVTKHNVDYYIFAMKVKEIDNTIIRNREGKEITILDNGYMYIQILPIGKNYSLTMTYDTTGKFVEWYFDITANNFLDERGMPFYEDLYLDIILTQDKKIYLIDKEELEEAYNKKDVSKEQYEFAKRQAKLLELKILENFDMLNKISIKYFNTFFKKKEIKVEDKRNTYRVDIKPGLKVAIVLKKDQKTGILTEGIVKDILTNSAIHHRGIKVRLEDGQVGRVQKILD